MTSDSFPHAWPRTLWFLNLDAEGEMATGRYRPPNARRLEMIRRAQRLLKTEFPQADLILDLDAWDRARLKEGAWEGRTWSPTPSAMNRLAETGVEIKPAPRWDVVRNVNSRQFQHHLQQTLLAASERHRQVPSRFCTELNQLTDFSDELGEGFIAKRLWAASGTGIKRLPKLGRTRDLSEANRRWIEKGLNEGGLLLEREVPVQTEFTIHGWIREDGTIFIGAPCQQTCHGGAWSSTEKLQSDGLSRGWILEDARRVAQSLQDEGYHGPFGIDSYEWRGSDGQLRTQRIADINARFTMGWGLGFSDQGGFSAPHFFESGD